MACTEYIKDGHQGALTGEDFWSRAEAFIESRRRGEAASVLMMQASGFRDSVF
ncbi:hypothetical protein FB45DRAFT_1061727 [Roridomyces roridus]|uniref:Uncharacterized protein n=1 Tax=Roridomyces roridus TaxID=1738132 RepID=A0AAD7BIC5_9AGAR|nr:hypothetical protein FB45DRAFT_1061727 [Roridomyces roridus]